MASTAATSSGVMGLVCEKSKRRRCGLDQRALLGDVRSQHLAQGLVQKVGGGVVGARGGAARMIDDQLDRIARLEGALLDAADVHEQVAQLLLRVGDAEQRALRLP